MSIENNLIGYSKRTSIKTEKSSNITINKKKASNNAESHKPNSFKKDFKYISNEEIKDRNSSGLINPIKLEHKSKE